MSRAINLGVKYVRRAPYQAAAVVLVMAITFFITTLVALLVFGSQKLLTYFETRPQVIAFLKTDVTEAQQNSLREMLGNDSRVKDIKVVSKGDAFTMYKDATRDNPLLGELVSPSIFPASLEFSLSELAQAQNVIGDLKKSPYVDTVGFTANLGSESHLGDAIDKLRAITKNIRIGGIVSVSVLMGTSFVVLLVVMSMRVSMRRAEIESLSLIGANTSFIRAPILMEALVYACLGIFVGWMMAFLLVLYASPTLNAYFGQVEVLPGSLLALLQIMGVILLFELIAGLIISFFGAVFSVNRSLRMVR